MARKVAVLWHASFSIGAGVLYFYFVLPRWPELMNDTSHPVGTMLRILTGVLVGLAGLPVLFTLLRNRKPELGTPQLALSLRTWSIAAHALAGLLIVVTAISEIWLSLGAVGQWLFGVYGAAAAIAVLAFFAFHLSFVAELPPKPRKAKEPQQRSVRRRRKCPESVSHEAAEADDTDDADDAEGQAAEPAPVTAELRGGLRNRRPTGKTSHRRKHIRDEVAVEN